jgi:hypothetical protein
MKMRGLVFILASLALIGADALRLEKRDEPAVVIIPLQKRSPQPSLRKRQGEVQVPDLNYMTQLLYIVQLQIGTPPQTTFVQLDTGSSDLVVETDSSNICTASSPNPCTNFGACENYFLNPFFNRRANIIR